MTYPRLLRFTRSVASLLVAGAVACSVPPSDATITIEAPSDTNANWQPVADYLIHRCGALDCHGTLQRNFIVFGCNGVQINPGDAMPGLYPFCPALPPKGLLAGSAQLEQFEAAEATVPEYDATYRSLVGLEPVVMSEVVASGGQNPDQLTFVRKARGEEAHKGGALITPGDAQDQCITSWLAGTTNTNACGLAIETTP